MIQTKSGIQKNKNNKTKPANLLKKEYLESYEELKKTIRENQKMQRKPSYFYEITLETLDTCKIF